jgi:hypothetical protein
LALAVRAAILDAHPYTAEAAHYAMARDLWHGVRNLDSLFDDVVPDTFSWFFWQRPLLCLLYWPGAQFGFTGFRVEHILVSSAVPVLAAVLLRQLGTRPSYAYGCAAVLCVHPVLVPWSVLVLPDSTVAALTLAGLLAAHAGRPVLTGALLLAGAWVKEVGFVTAAALFVLACWREADGTRARPWPLRLGPFATVLLPVTLLSFLPLYVSLHLPFGAMPGFRIGGGFAQSLERLFLLLWLAPVAAFGLALPSVRRFALAAGAWPAFFIVFHVLTHKAVEIWYNVVPATMVACAAAATLSALPRSGTAAQRWAPAALTVLVVTLLAVQVAVPQGAALNRAAVTPLSHEGQWDLPQAMAEEHTRDDDLFAAIADVTPDHHKVWTALDMDYSLVMFPLAAQAGRMNKDFTPDGDVPDEALRWWAGAIERKADATFLAGPEHASDLNQALREAYAPCAHAHGLYTVIQAQGCQGYDARLIETYHRIHGAAVTG